MSDSTSDTEKLEAKTTLEIAGESVTVRVLKVKEFAKLYEMAIEEDEIGMVSLYTGRPKDWVGELDMADYDELVEAGERLNLVPFERWQERRNRRRDQVFPGYKDVLAKMAQQTMNPSGPTVVSRDGQRTSPLPVDLNSKR